MKRHDLNVWFAQDLPHDRTVLIISPHPDDTSIGVGGTAALLAKKNRVVSAVMTTGHRAQIKNKNKAQRIAQREREAQREAKILGVECVCLQLPLYDTGTISQIDLEKATALLEECKPDIILMPNLQDPHPTHRVCTQVVMHVLTRSVQWQQRMVQVWYYESPWSLFNRGDYSALVAIPARTFATKLKAIRTHGSQNTRTRYDVIATSLARLRAEIIPEQSLAGYGDTPPDVGSYVEIFSVVTMGREAKLVQSLSGIRGIFRRGLTAEVAESYGYTYGRWLKRTLGYNPKVIVGLDTRRSGPVLKEGLLRGLTRAHCHLFDIGIATTPMVQFEVRNRACDGGVMITASHNEPEWNGFKFLWKDGGALAPEQMTQVVQQYLALTDMTERPHVAHYVQYLIDWLGVDGVARIRNGHFKIVLDPNGGAMVVVIENLFRQFGIETIRLNAEAGRFHHRIEPTAQALKDMAPVIDKARAHLGVAWDCDGDRVEIMLPGGELLSGHRILALLVDQILCHLPKKQTVVVNTMTSGVVAAIAKRYDARVVQADVGESNVVEQMSTLHAAVGGEGGSGGGIVPPSRCRDGVMTMLKILELQVERKKTLAEILRDYPEYSTTLFNLKMRPANMTTLQEIVLRNFPDACVSRVGDSCKLDFADGTFVCLRASHTEPNLLRVVIDSPHAERTQQLAAQMMEWCTGLTTI